MSAKASACAKTILFGEHAVVYDEPAISIPLHTARTHASFTPNGKEFKISSPKIHLYKSYDDLIKGSGLQVLLSIIRERFELSEFPKETLLIRSDIPIASGLGSGAAVSVAVTRAFSAYFHRDMSDSEVNAIAYEVEKVYHGTPSGIDNTTIAYEQPIIFIKSKGFEHLRADIKKLYLLVVDSGIRSRTIDVVSDVREHFQQNEPIIRQIGSLVRSAVGVLESGTSERIGEMMNENQKLLQVLNVSCPELDELITLGLSNGALGGKLTGAGRGGNFLILAKDRENALRLKQLYHKRGLQVIL